jgi:hypothetical protein
VIGSKCRGPNSDESEMADGGVREHALHVAL